MLTLDNFANQLDPELLDRAQMLWQSGQIARLEDEGEQVWSAVFRNGPTASVSLGKGDRIEGAVCSCGEYDEALWEEQPCVHVAAAYFALREKRAEKPAAKRAKKSAKAEKPVVIRPAPVPKDPAEALLRELEPGEVVEFLRQALGRNKELKSQFLLHFADKNTHAGQFDEIVVNAIGAVKGRRKYLPGGDGSKIAVALHPLYKQAAAAEGRGLFRETFAACRALLQHLPDVFSRLENESAKLRILFEQTATLLAHVVEHGQTPFELRDEIFETLLKLYREQHQSLASDIQVPWFDLVRRAARATGRTAELAGWLRREVDSAGPPAKYASWDAEHFAELAQVKRLYLLYEEDLRDEAAALDLLERYKRHGELYRLLIRRKIGRGDYAGALAGIEDMQKNSRQYDGAFGGWGVFTQLNTLLAEVYNKSGQRQKLIQLAARLFKESGYMNFDFYEMEKAAHEPADWPARVDALLKELFKSPVLFGSVMHPYFEVLSREQRWPDLRAALVKHTTQIGLWYRYGPQLTRHFPDDFFTGAEQALEIALRQANAGLYSQVTGLLQTMTRVEGGAEKARELIERFREKYGNRPALMSALNQV
jgi:hypothetical protein